MAIGKAIAKARNGQAFTQEDLAIMLNVSRESESKYENETRNFPKDLIPKVCDILDDPFLYFAAASEDTGGSWVKELNGDYIDLHRSSVAAKTREELDEALNAIESISVANHPNSLKDHDRCKLEKAMMESIDAMYALSHYVAIVCQDYGYSWKDMWDKHTRKLISLGYLKKEGVR